MNAMANAKLEFKHPDPSIKEVFVTEIGFNNMPDWVEKDPYFKICQGGLTPLIQPFESNSDKAINAAEELAIENALLKEQIRSMQEKKEQEQLTETLETAVEEVVTGKSKVTKEKETEK